MFKSPPLAGSCIIGGESFEPLGWEYQFGCNVDHTQTVYFVFFPNYPILHGFGPELSMPIMRSSRVRCTREVLDSVYKR